MSELDVFAEKLHNIEQTISELKSSRENRGARLGTAENSLKKLECDQLHIKCSLEKLAGEVNDLRELTMTVHELAISLKGIKEDLDEVKIALKSASARPQAWLDKLVWAVIGGGLASVVAYFMTKVL